VIEAVAEALAVPPATVIAEEPRDRKADQSKVESVEPKAPGTDSLVALLRTSPADGSSFEHRIDPAHGSVSLDDPDHVVPPMDDPAWPDGEQFPLPDVVSETDRVEEFLPLLRVEYFLWPDECLKIGSRAPDQLALLTASLQRQSASGQKVVALGGHAAGEGSTTTLLSAAKSLAESGVKTIIVDADFGNPCLAERLGVACRAGWDDVLSDGEPLAEAIIESDRDRLALAPLRRLPAGVNDGLDRRGDLGAMLWMLRSHYDLVLVDLGKLDADTLLGDGIGGPVKDCIDAIVVVRDVRNGRQSQMDHVNRLLHQAELVELGVIENFA
jgi:Mrp family chromosome partitioning ATPase